MATNRLDTLSEYMLKSPSLLSRDDKKNTLQEEGKINQESNISLRDDNCASSSFTH